MLIHKIHWNADDLNFPILYHTVVYTMYSAHGSQFNSIPNLVTMVTHNFLTKWFPWQSMSYDMSTISFLASIRNMGKVGLKLTKLQPEVSLFRNIVSKTIILP